MKIRILYVVVVFASLASCSYFFNEDNTEDVVARVNDNYLSKEDISKIIPKGASKADSTLIAQNYINTWARKLLLLDNAKRNLPEAKQKEFNGLIDRYKTELYTKAYLEGLVKRSIDSMVNLEEAKKVYEANKESFKLNDELLQLRYISLSQNVVNLQDIKDRFINFGAEDQQFLDSISVQFNSYTLKDSTWVRANQVLEKIPPANQTNKNQLLKKSNFIELKDSLNLYLIQINDVLLRNDYAPLEYVRPTVNQIVLNRRKLELIEEIEKEILNDANKNKQFEIYK